ncbi:MAG TPA: CsbD family protein [Longilinea sp.]|nr:CsbD family protein [Longilinea sp.]
MNKDIFEGKWKELRGQIKELWGKLTDDELDKAAGNSEQIIGLLQQKYGYTREHAVEELNKHVAEFKAGLKK